MGELSQITNVSVLAAVAIGLIYFLVLLAPKVRALFVPVKNGNGSEVQKVEAAVRAKTMYPDMCVPCRQTVDRTNMEVREHRKESKERDNQILEVLGEIRDIVRDAAADIRRTGDGIRVPPAGRPGSRL